MSRSTYIVAVSGGVDSVVLLDMLATHNLETAIFGFDPSFIVAHFDHGIRTESADDTEFVSALAKKYGLPFEHEQAELGAGASESLAREARYKFLRQYCKKYNASGLIMAHHQDDQIETAVINMLRGTSWRGLASLEPRSTQYGIDIIRPLLHKTKEDILTYAKSKKLQWMEDATNKDQAYLRNKIRLSVLPELLKNNPEFIKQLKTYIMRVQELKVDISKELVNILAVYIKDGVQDLIEIPRYDLIVWPEVVAKEMIYTILRRLEDSWHPNSLQIQKALLFCKTAQIGKELQIGSNLRVISKKQSIQFKKI